VTALGEQTLPQSGDRVLESVPQQVFEATRAEEVLDGAEVAHRAMVHEDVRQHHRMVNGIRDLGQQLRVAGRVNDLESVALLPEKAFGPPAVEGPVAGVEDYLSDTCRLILPRCRRESNVPTTR